MKILTPVRVTDSNLSEQEKLAKRQEIVAEAYQKLPSLFDTRDLPKTVGQKNCENWLGSISLPVGVAGPVGIIYQNQPSSHYLPIATTEGALVASISRGSKAIGHAGGAKVMVKKSGMTRSPVFACQSGEAAFKLEEFINQNKDELIRLAQSTSRHLTYLSHQSWVRGRHLYLRLCFDTDQAMGMNMVTIATQAVTAWLEASVHDVRLIALSSNVCSDKKDNFINTLLGRGYWAQAEVWLSKDVLAQVLKTNPETMIKTHLQKNLVGSNLAGSFSQNAHVANVLAGVFLATGQDPAHIIEGSRAFLAVEPEAGGVYVSLTLPNLNMGTVGGGTYLPAQKEVRQLMGFGDLPTDRLVAITAAGCLAGEISLLAALSNQTLAKAHQELAR